jgi:hypothetical protein
MLLVLHIREKKQCNNHSGLYDCARLSGKCGKKESIIIIPFSRPSNEPGRRKSVFKTPSFFAFIYLFIIFERDEKTKISTLNKN